MIPETRDLDWPALRAVEFFNLILELELSAAKNADLVAFL